MRPAAPLEILFLIVLTAALLTSLHARVKFPLPLDELLDT